jgi:hypothetical protein
MVSFTSQTGGTQTYADRAWKCETVPGIGMDTV